MVIRGRLTLPDGVRSSLTAGRHVVVWAFILIFGSICLALALAFGLGGREAAARYLERWFRGKKQDEVTSRS